MVIAVVGAGSIGRRHAGNLDALGARAELIPWRDADLAALARRQDIGALVVATATDIRLDLIRIAAERDWPVYVEKPLAFRQTDVAAIYEIAREIAGRSMLGLMMRYHPVVAWLRDSGEDAAYGFHFEIGHDVRQWRQNWSFRDSYAARAEGGGVLLDLCHEIDMAACLFPGLAVIAADALGHREFPGVDFATRIALSRPDGPVGTVAMDYIAPVGFRRTALRSANAAINADLLSCTVRRNGEEAARFDFDRNDMFLDAMRDFLALIEGREPGPRAPRLDHVRESAELVAAAWEARVFRGNVQMSFD